MKTALGKTCPACGERYEPGVLFCPIDGTPLSSSARTLSDPSVDTDPYLGLELEGQIKLSTLVGIGSMGRVYRAFQSGVDRDVAVKVLHRELVRNPELVTRFHREAKIASRLVHPNVVQVLMTGTIPERSDRRVGGEVYLVMEYLDGISLLSALAAAGAEEGDALPLPRALHIVMQLCDAVGEAHAQGVVHRDLKPENIMLVRRAEDQDFVKVLDFGIARLDWAEAGSTQAGLIFGTAKYISPEGAEGLRVGPQADVYAIATIFYQCLAGRTPFEGDQPMALLMQQVQSPAPDLRSVNRASYVPDPIADVIMQNLAKDPSERANDARALKRELLSAARSAGLTLESMMGHASLKLESKQRTKQHELSEEVARAIGGLARRDSSPSRDPSSSRPPSPRASAPSMPTPRASAPSIAPPRASSPSLASQRASSPGESRLSDPSAPAQRTVMSDSSGHPADDTIPGMERVPGTATGRPGPTLPGYPLTENGSAAAARSDRATIQGHMVPVDSEEESQTEHGQLDRLSAARLAKRRSRSSRLAMLIGALVLVPVVALAAAHFIKSPTSAADADSAEHDLDAAREAMTRRAWDSPAGSSVKDITDRAMQKFPGDGRFVSIRQEAAERIVTDALGRKYAGSVDEALHLARLAVTLAPSLKAAQQLAHELEEAKGPSVEPGAPVGTESSARPNVRPPRTEPRAGPLASASSSARTAPSSSSSGGGSVLPPQPPPLPDDGPPPLSSSRPWL